MDVTDEDVFCDKTRLNQVLLNLLSNAIKFTLPGGTVSICVAQLPNAPEGKGLYEIRVKDTGIGMAISKNIIDMMGGTITVQTEKDKGTEFTVRLTLRLQSERRSVDKIKELEGLKALVVDDDFNTCDSVTKMLVQVGMRFEWTMFGKEAVLRAKQSMELNDPFHAYIIDWRLSDVNGIEVTRQIRALGDDTPIIILTAYDWSDIETEARTAGVTAFCAKPLFMSDLRESLMTALGQQELKNDDILPAAQDTNKFKNKQLLLVEDNELNREIALEILGEYGFQIDTADNGAEAVKQVVAHHEQHKDYFACIIDWKMPEMDGVETTRAIRKAVGPDVPIIIISAYDWSDIEQEARAAGANAFISKPLFRSRLERTFGSLLGEEEAEDRNSPMELLEELDFSEYRALLVEDNELNAEIAEEILKTTGIAVEHVWNGMEAVDRMNECTDEYYDIVFMDIQMPRMNGYDATRAIRAMDRNYCKQIPIIAMTANAFAEDVLAAKTVGMNEHIAKPLDLNTMARILKKWM